jgi:nitrite reductase/ring-hydroxylating ferredoxin subunit
MTWTKALTEDALPEGVRQVVKIGDNAILLFRQENQIHAVTNKCPHLGLPLQKGKITDNNTIVCPWHHSAFDINTGDVKAWSPWPPVLGKVLGCLTHEKALTIFPTKVEGGDIWVQIQ